MSFELVLMWVLQAKRVCVTAEDRIHDLMASVSVMSG